MSSSKGNKGAGLKARSLQYTAPETPNFLRALKAQVSVNDRAKYGQPATPKDQLSSLLSSSTTADGDERRESSDDDDGDDGAQIVVLNDKRHLTAEQAQQAKMEVRERTQAKSAPLPAAKTISVTTAGGQPSTKKRRREAVAVIDSHDLNEAQPVSSAIDTSPLSKKTTAPASTGGGDLKDVKELLRAEKGIHQASKDISAAQQGDKRMRKDKEAQTAKRKAGTGLSFSFDD